MNNISNRRLLHFLLTFFVTGGALCTLLSFFGQFYWLFDLLSHFRLQYVIAFIILFFIALLLKSKYAIGITLLCLIINLLPFIPFYIQNKPQAAQESVVVMMANVKMTNRDYIKTLQYIKKINPDVLVLEEVDASWVKELSTLKTRYPYQIAEARDDYLGLILLSKSPLQNPRVERIGRTGAPTIVTNIEISKKTITLIGTHPIPPFTQNHTQLRNDQLGKLAIFINKLRTPTVLVGDLNSSPFSYPYQKLIKDSNLKNCANGFGYQSTWHYTSFVPPLGLSIDHCLHTEGIMVLDSYVGEDIGSDHFPIINRISVQL